MRLFLAILLIIPFGLNAATFTEFYTDYGVGTNVNSGSTTNAAALYTSVSGHWTNSTATFVPTDGLDSSTNVSVGDWVSVFINGATNLVQSGSGGWVAQVTNVTSGVNGKIMLSQVAFMGTNPANQTNTATLKKGGAWNGPYGTIGFPFGFLATTATNAPNVFPRCNFKNTAQYNVTAAMTHANAGPIKWQGMTLAPGDGGKATIDGGTSGAAFTILTLSGADNFIESFVFQNNGASSQVAEVLVSGARSIVKRCVFRQSRGSGLSAGGGNVVAVIECESYACNAANNSAHGGINLSGSGSVAIRCVSHDNTGNANTGFILSANGNVIGCIAFANGKDGLKLSGTTTSINASGCDFYGNTGSGIDLANSSAGSVYIENCNFVNNSAFGITSSGSSLRNGQIINCGFGSGTKTNSSGGLASILGGIIDTDTLLYSADQTPWTDPANGDFRITLTTAKSAGRGLFTFYSTNSPTVGYPDIGAAQSASTNAAASGGGSYTFAQ